MRAGLVQAWFAFVSTLAAAAFSLAAVAWSLWQGWGSPREFLPVPSIGYFLPGTVVFSVLAWRAWRWVQAESWDR